MRNRKNPHRLFFAYWVSIFVLLRACFNHHSSAKFKGIHEYRLFHKAHICAPAVVELFEKLFLLICKVFLRVLWCRLCSREVLSSLLNLFGYPPAVWCCRSTTLQWFLSSTTSVIAKDDSSPTWLDFESSSVFIRNASWMVCTVACFPIQSVVSKVLSFFDNVNATDHWTKV